MRVTARADYALRAVVQLAALGASPGQPVGAEQLAAGQEIPRAFLDNLLVALRRAGIVASLRGPQGGYWLATPPEQLSLAQVIRAIDGPLAHVRGRRPERLGYPGAATALRDVWVALRASEREVLDGVTVAQVAGGRLPTWVRALATGQDVQG